MARGRRPMHRHRAPTGGRQPHETVRIEVPLTQGVVDRLRKIAPQAGCKSPTGLASRLIKDFVVAWDED